MSVQYVKLGDVCAKDSSNIAQKDLKDCFGKYPVYGAAGYIQNVDFYHQEDEYIAIVKDGAGVGRAMILPAKSSVIGTMQYIIPDKNKVDMYYLYYAIINMALGKYFSGATIPHIYFKDYQKEIFKLPDLETQKKIADNLKNIDLIIAKKNKQIGLFNELVKSRFIEMFGDPEENNKNMLMKSMTDICKIIDGDRGKSYPKQEEFLQKGYCLFLNAKNVTQEGFVFKSCLYITQEKDSVLRNGKLERGDIVLTTRGTIGNLAFYNEKVPFNNIRINSGMVILRLNRKFIKEKFFIEQFKLLLSSIKNKIASGSAQPQLPISTMYKIKIILPPMILQEKFVSFLEHTDKSKFGIQKSLNYLI